MRSSVTRSADAESEVAGSDPVTRRHAHILEIVREQGFCTIGELARLLAVSEMTVRRDVQRLGPDSGIRVVHGGVTVLAPQALTGTGTFSIRTAQSSDRKAAIGRAVAASVPYGQTLAMDAGTTTLQLGRALPLDLTGTVITHSVPLIRVLMRNEGLQVLCPGGVLHAATQSFEGPITLAALTNLHVDVLYLAASSIGPNGIYCGNDYDAVTKRSLIEISDRVVLLADSTKFARTAMVRVCTLDRLDEIVTDSDVTAEQIALIEDAGSTVTVAPR
jgi:DeoR/GlpR family transcriptional regulator of sugar metabolism